MRFQGFIGPSYTLKSVKADCQRCINLYPEMNEIGTGKEGEVATLVSTPGLTLLGTLANSPVRGVFTDSKGQLWAVGGSALYQISSTWAATLVGNLLTNSGPVDFKDNGISVVMVDGTYGYTWTVGSGSSFGFSQIVDASFYGAARVAFIDTYFIYNKPSTSQFYSGPSNAVTPFNGLDIGSAEAYPENMVGLEVLQENIFLFSQRHLEVWYDSGAASFQFARIQGAVIEIGCSAAFSIAKLGQAIYWLGQDKDGSGIVYKAQGLQPQRISTFAIENKIASLGDMSTARAWSYQQSGHFFYCLNLPGADTTWVYDTSSGMWHERAYLTSDGNYSRHLVDCHALAYGVHVVGDYLNGNFYSLNPAAFSDNGNPIIRERTTPHISKDMNRIFHERLELDIETGVGIDGSGQGSDPQVMLQWSNDGGVTWSNEHWAAIGKIGDRRNRVIWRRLGKARERTYRVRISDPVSVTLLGADLDLQEGAS